jgi:hypothetical protein
MSLLSRYKFEIAGLAMGAVAGWSYWYFIGCTSGTCPITSQPVNSSVYGSVMGWLAGGMFTGSRKNSLEKENLKGKKQEK